MLIKGVNDNEIGDFIAVAKKHPVDVRFIELMPMGDGGNGVKTDEILKNHSDLTLCENQIKSAPAVYYTGVDFKGRVGFISPLSHKFCQNCNRLRITSDGTIRPCLGANLEFYAREAIVNRDKNDFIKILKEAVNNKPEKSCFGGEFTPSRTMNRIGG